MWFLACCEETSLNAMWKIFKPSLVLEYVSREHTLNKSKPLEELL